MTLSPPPPLRLGNINQVRGELSEAVNRYSAVLHLQPHYLPALKGWCLYSTLTMCIRRMCVHSTLCKIPTLYLYL